MATKESKEPTNEEKRALGASDAEIEPFSGNTVDGNGGPVNNYLSGDSLKYLGPRPSVEEILKDG